jgi:hypothetical protein
VMSYCCAAVLFYLFVLHSLLVQSF